MALLTAEDVLNKAFSKTKYREGFDQDEVDDFLDEVANTIAALTAERDELQSRLAQAGGGAYDAAPAPQAAPLQSRSAMHPRDAAADGDDANPPTATTMLAMAQKLHDDYVQAGEAERTRILDEARAEASQIRSKAEQEALSSVERAETEARAAVARIESDRAQLERERTDLERKVDELRRFERDYRSHLRGYLEGLLGDLESSASRAAAGPAERQRSDAPTSRRDGGASTPSTSPYAQEPTTASLDAPAQGRAGDSPRWTS